MCNKVKILLNLLIVCAMSVAQAQHVETSPVSVAGTYTATAVRGRLDLRCHSLSLTADSLAKDTPTTFYAFPLHVEQLPPVPTTLKVVTGGKCHGYRLLPNGDHFPKGATMRLTYDPARIPAGHSFRDIRTYYYDESSREWKALKLIEIDTINKEVVSLTTHFTDFINGVMQEPEAPEVEGFVPTTMSKRPAAKPLMGLPLLEPPSANSGGTAELSYPLAIPAGRGGMQPNLALTYSSGGGDGWTGIGWDIAVPKISVETRWGVPRYNPAKESDIYLYNGNHLVTKNNGGHFDPSTATTMRYDPQRPTDSIVSVAICDGWGRPLQSKTEYGTASSIVSGSCLYDEFGRAVVQYYPFFGGVPDTVFNPNYNVSTATTTVYDVLDRKKIRYPPRRARAEHGVWFPEPRRDAVRNRRHRRKRQHHC